ncbi:MULTISPECIES: chaperone NapD [unclassified Atlantibacter]|uniref:chaperone NapD n=1 Tax=unclassified Atlantibacter TaxID=2649394 RepID=UPI00160589B3|nr:MULTISPECIES: chaperone NapD [unclassified Atlantibacter]MBB3321562.1 nitrate reductase NapD [Atlantibacter sp. RC6]
MSSEWHVSSLFVQTRPDATESVTQLLNAMANTEVAASEETTGKLVVVMEAASSAALIERIESARNLAGVLAVSLVYHQQDEQGEETP